MNAFAHGRRRLPCVRALLASVPLLIAATAFAGGGGGEPASTAAPAGDEALRARTFAEPLVPIPLADATGEDASEGAALSRALAEWTALDDPDDLAPLEAFLASHPRSRFRVALQLNLGLHYYRHGYVSRALDSYREAWELGRHWWPARAAEAQARRRSSP